MTNTYIILLSLVAFAVKSTRHLRFERANNIIRTFNPLTEVPVDFELGKN